MTLVKIVKLDVYKYSNFNYFYEKEVKSGAKIATENL